MANSSRVWLVRECGYFAADLFEGAKVLDAGAGDQPYRRLFAHCEYEAADFEKVDKPYAKSTYVCDLAAIPVEDHRFDAVIFSQVMEHLPDPLSVLNELARVLKPGGSIFCSAPLFYAEHEQPYDFYRYTQFAFRHLFDKAGFEIGSISWLEGYLGTVSYQLRTAAFNLPYRPQEICPGMLGFVMSPLLLALKGIFLAAAFVLGKVDSKYRFQLKGYPKNYVVRAKKR